MEAALHIIAAHHILFPRDRQLHMAQFVNAFMIYNAHTNLSAIREKDAIWLKHIVDSLMLLKFESVHGTMLDIGTGGGLPGIPLAIAAPELDATLLDSVGKKIAACQSFIETLRLSNTRAVQGRAEQLIEQAGHRHHYDIVVSRATAYLPIILAWSEPFIKAEGRIILYKTPSDEERADGEAVATQLGLRLRHTHSYELDQQRRSLLVYERSEHTAFNSESTS